MYKEKNVYKKKEKRRMSGDKRHLANTHSLPFSPFFLMIVEQTKYLQVR